ncbi:hypothetical protein P175DRAFT_0523064 [Aspergillus ochraceoroseus IBT 24754]|uniref:Uncharacterized protein n=1 Tax=Aspergillus ochraceoroseus IBT 24754 TaxID=1392256 RepID=A0A2T5M007_9EURO|nr:uncharacterized protein P175DRAFT_0523064 [Aspergillus ochraceoroseus IBT 24754]PTU21856.1 hypothetical protein P175DRAFT_0523064 [Aspergillus ochraceoroseus IBT 24754]
MSTSQERSIGCPYLSQLLGLNKFKTFFDPDPCMKAALSSDQLILGTSSKSVEKPGRLVGFNSTVLALRLKRTYGDDEDDLKKKSLGQFCSLGKRTGSVNEEHIPQDFDVLFYFERYLDATQVQRSFLTCVHERLVISEPQHLSALSLQGLYGFAPWIIDNAHIPVYRLFYLARGRDHECSTANLQIARQSSLKRRAHLRVRIRAIAGVLALRAAVSKSTPAMDNTESEDWELGIPPPSLTTDDDVLKVIAGGAPKSANICQPG